MLLNTKQMTISFAVAAGVLWAVCSALVALSPALMTTMTGHMLHMDLTNNGLSMNMPGFFIGMIGWMIMAAAFAWLLGSIYNYSVGRKSDSGKAG